MAIAESGQEEVSSQAVAKKKGGNRMVMVLGAVILLLLGGYGYMLGRMHGDQAKSGAAAEKPVPKPAELYLPLEPAFVVNFQDQDSTRYLQVGVTVMTHEPAVVQAVKDADPVIRNALVMLFSSQSYTELADTAGKKKLQAQALDAVRKIINDKTGKPGVDALYFTSFVMQ